MFLTAALDEFSELSKPHPDPQHLTKPMIQDEENRFDDQSTVIGVLVVTSVMRFVKYVDSRCLIARWMPASPSLRRSVSQS